MLASSLTGSSGDLVRPNQDDDRFLEHGSGDQLRESLRFNQVVHRDWLNLQRSTLRTVEPTSKAILVRYLISGMYWSTSLVQSGGVATI